MYTKVLVSRGSCVYIMARWIQLSQRHGEMNEQVLSETENCAHDYKGVDLFLCCILWPGPHFSPHFNFLDAQIEVYRHSNFVLVIIGVWNGGGVKGCDCSPGFGRILEEIQRKFGQNKKWINPSKNIKIHVHTMLHMHAYTHTLSIEQK